MISRLQMLAPDRPEVAESRTEPHRGVCVGGADGELERGQQVRPLHRELAGPLNLVRPAQARLGALGQAQEIVRVPSQGRSDPVRVGEPLQAVLADRLQHLIARPAVVDDVDQRLVHQRVQAVQARAQVPGRRCRERGREHRQPLRGVPLHRVE